MTKQEVKIKEMKPGDCFSEMSHYVYNGSSGNYHSFTHLGTGETVELGTPYVQKMLQCAEQYHQEVKVGKEDKFWTQAQLDKAKNITNRVGDIRLKGIRTIWQEISGKHVFSVCYNKAAKSLSNRALAKQQKEQLEAALEDIRKAARQKKGVVQVAADVLKTVQENPILPIIPGEERILRGYKVQFQSRS